MAQRATFPSAQPLGAIFDSAEEVVEMLAWLLERRGFIPDVNGRLLPSTRPGSIDSESRLYYCSITV